MEPSRSCWPEVFSQKIAKMDVVDFENSIAALEVKVKLPTADDPAKPRNSQYCYMLPSIGCKGLALIINIVEFEHLPRREGSERDMEYLYNLLLDLDYKVYPNNLLGKLCNEKKTKKEIQEMIKEFRESCAAEQPESIIVFIGSHGEHNRIYTSDSDSRQYLDLYQDIVYEFSHELSPELKGKPKIFLVQACQSFPEPGWIDEEDRRATRENMCIRDVLVFTASIPGTTSNRDALKGSWLPYCFTYVMMENALKMRSLQEILSMVVIMMRKIEEKTGLVQIPVITQVDFKDLYFSGNGVKLGSGENSAPRFTIPINLKGFVEDMDDIKLCIVITDGIEISYQKIREYLLGESKEIWYFDEFDKFRDRICSSQISPFPSNVLTVVNGENATELSFPFRVHQLMSMENVDKLSNNKVVFLTRQPVIGELWELDTETARSTNELIIKNNTNKVKMFVVTDSLKWVDLDDAYRYKIYKRLELRYRTEISVSDLAEEFDNLNKYGDICLKQSRRGEVLQPGYFIESSLMLRTRSIMSKTVFEKEDTPTDDIFVIENIGLDQMQSETGGRAVTSATFINGCSQAKFVWLHPSENFDRICSSTDSPAVHLLRYQKGLFRWVRSRGDIRSLYKYMATTTTQVEWDDVDLFSALSPHSNHPICVFGGMGTGKSVWLRKMGDKLRKVFLDRTVFVTNMDKFIVSIKDEKAPNKIDGERVEYALKDLLYKETRLRGPIFESKLHSDKISIELLLDDFDSVNRTDPVLGWEVLRFLKESFKSIRLWVTSRTELMEEMETKLQVLGYKLGAFPEPDKIRQDSPGKRLFPAGCQNARFVRHSVQRPLPCVGPSIGIAGVIIGFNPLQGSVWARLNPGP